MRMGKLIAGCGLTLFCIGCGLMQSDVEPGATATTSASEIPGTHSPADLDPILSLPGVRGKLNLFQFSGYSGDRYDTTVSDSNLGSNHDSPYNFDNRASSLVNKTNRHWNIYRNKGQHWYLDHLCVRPRSYIRNFNSVEWDYFPLPDVDSIDNELSSVKIGTEDDCMHNAQKVGTRY